MLDEMQSPLGRLAGELLATLVPLWRVQPSGWLANMKCR